MLKKMKCYTVLLVLVFMLQSILMSAVYAAETANVVLEISIPQLSLTGYSNAPKTIELIWTSTDNSIKGESYDIYRDGNVIKNTESFTYTDKGLASQTKYTYLVKAKDAEGEVIAESNILSVTTPPESSDTGNLTGSAISLQQSGVGEILEHGDPGFKTDRFIVKYKNKNSKKSARKAFEKMDAKTNIFDKEFKELLKENKQDKDIKPFSNNIESSLYIADIGNNSGNGNIDMIPLSEDATLQEFTAALEKNNITENIEYVQPDYQLSLSSNDPYYSSQWGLKNNSEETKNNVDTTVSKELKVTDSALNIQTGLKQNFLCDAGVSAAWEKAAGKDVTVAVIDTGIDITHEDLTENIWINEKEISGNGIDDDGNGKIDDINGWNFSDNSNIVCDNANLAGENHGTHLAGIISAVKDNSKGIAGVAPSAKVMPLKVFENGKAYTSDVINAIQYAESMGVKIVNCSWGSTDDNPVLKEAIQSSGMLFVCAAGNSSADIDSNPVYPAAFDCSNIIVVASINQNGQLSSFSNFGQNNVDVAAPGEGIYSTLTGNTYGEKSGTSMSAAFVSGEAALILSKESTATINDIKDEITKTSNKYSNLLKKICDGNVINCYNAVNSIPGTSIEVKDSQINDTVTGQLNSDLGLFSIDSTATYTSTNLFPQPLSNNEFKVRGGGVFTAAADNCIYKYDYTQNKTWTYHGFDVLVDMNSSYTYSFDAYISPDTDIQDTGTTFIAGGENGFVHPFYYDNSKKGEWQHFECTMASTSDKARILLYPTSSTIPATTGYILYKNVKFKKCGTNEDKNLFSQVTDNNGFTVKGNGYFDCKVISCKYDYGYSQNLTWTYHGFSIPLDTNSSYTYSFDAYISPDANIKDTETTFIASGEDGFVHAFYYDNTQKGTWQHFEYTAKPSSDKAYLLLYPTGDSIPATTGYLSYKNVEFKKATDDKNLFPQYLENEDFSIRAKGYFNCNANYIYKYQYNQNFTWTYHGLPVPLDINSYYTYSFDAYISPNANIQDTGTTFIASGEAGFVHAFYYDNTKKGIWQHFEYTAKPSSDRADLLLYPTGDSIPATTGYISYKNVEFIKQGSNINLFKQVDNNNGFIYKGHGVFECIPSHMYNYEYNQNKMWTYHGFSIPVNTNSCYLYSFDAYISPDANIKDTETTFIASGEDGFVHAFYYDNTKKGTWQHFEYTAKPSSDKAYLLLYPTNSNIPATTGYILYRNVSFKEVFPTISLSKTSTVKATSGNTFKLTIKLKNAKSLSDRTFTITYNTSDITAVTDLCKLTYKKETATGAIAGTGITILKNEPGTIIFCIDKDIPDNKSWSGVVNVIEFKPAVSGDITLNCKVE